MASDLLTIAASGARAARGALDVTAQNIANAATDGYVRRSLRIEEVASSGGAGRVGDISLSGARVADIHRNADAFMQAELRRTSGDLERATTELSALRNIESAVEQSGLFTAIVEFEASLQQLASDPVDPSRRAAVLGEAGTLAAKFNIAADGLEAIGDGLRFNAQAQVSELNTLGEELARVNLRLTRAGSGSSDQAALLDQRDQLLERAGAIAALGTSLAADGTVAVTLGRNPAVDFVQGGNFGAVTSTAAADGTVSFAVNGQPLNPGSGALTGATLGLTEIVNTRRQLDALALSLAQTVKTAQANGTALDGSPGQPIFAGTGARDFAVALSSGAGLATAPAGSPAGSRDQSNLVALRQAITTADPAQAANGLIFDISSKVASRTVTHSAIETIASAARVSLEQQSGVDLDTEAANLIRFQQAFQASGRAMQVASDIFNTLLGIG